MPEYEYKIIERDGEGNYVDAKVFLPKLMIDMGTMKQIKRMIHHPSVHHPRIMPDCHYNHGCCVGFTSQLGKTLVPNFIGGDIGCGILTYRLKKNALDHLSLVEFEKMIQQVVVMGSQTNCVHKEPIVTEEELSWLFTESQDEAINFAKEYEKKYEVDLSHWLPKYNLEWLKKKCVEIRLDFDYFLQSAGTLGGGNHFIEVNQDSDKRKYITVHTGSRSFGSRIKYFHQEKINETIS